MPNTLSTAQRAALAAPYSPARYGPPLGATVVTRDGRRGLVVGFRFSEDVAIVRLPKGNVEVSYAGLEVVA